MSKLGYTETEECIGCEGCVELCPDASCVSNDGRITIPAVGAEPAEKRGIWLKLFCPEGSCELKEGTDLP